MKRTVVLLRSHARAGSVLLTLCLMITGGCSGSGDEGGDAVAKVAANSGLDRSEFVALKKAHKNPKNFEKAVQKREIEKLREQGVVERSKKSEKATSKSRRDGP